LNSANLKIYIDYPLSTTSCPLVLEKPKITAHLKNKVDLHILIVIKFIFGE